MTVSRREGPFVADITGGLLSARRETSEAGRGAGGAYFHTAAASEPLFILPVAEMPGFVMRGDGLYTQHARSALTALYRGDDAAQLLRCITDLMTTVEGKRSRRRGFIQFFFAVAVACLTGLLLGFASEALTQLAARDTRLLTTVDTPQVFHPVPGPARLMPAEPGAADMTPSWHKGWRVDSPALIKPPQAQAPSDAAPDDGWDLPQSVRSALPAKLHSAASRGLFTVPLSSGHARTIYVFADPACPNCQRMERHFETAAGTVNVVIFPVTIEGREASLKALTPVMALPEAERAAAWKQLFAADAGIGVPGGAQVAPAPADENQAETARGAIGVNEVAFRAYRLPGTPWTISDDGRYVPQSVLSSPAALTAFLNGGGHDGQ
ncbi:thioredoxin fold domain-containing protein (plasmid) [Pantoea sp. JZ2]|uniref:thioredoxin fold domain-containing protein n=1 Tax=Pantoea sp. JZ2 TaxID=2654189 RepID=UPI002B490ACE|nr:thioredoxin fold domain-containing protein [Pantoea sp. JZ2]WRH15917.1 thioredoxin fold domain-containing protein [Pantoea sp. JZ2]